MSKFNYCPTCGEILFVGANKVYACKNGHRFELLVSTNTQGELVAAMHELK